MADLASSITVARNAGYSDADITAYLAKDPTLGPQVDQARKSGYNDGEIVGFLATQKPKKPDTLTDMAKGAVSGLSQVVSSASEAASNFLPGAGFGMKAGAALSNITNRALHLKPLFDETTPQALADSAKAPSLARPSATPASDATASRVYQPQTTAGKYTRTIAQFAPAALAPGSAASRLASVVVPAVTSETSGQVANHFGASPQVEQAARVVGALGGGLASSLRFSPKATPTADDTVANIYAQRANADPQAMSARADEMRAAGVEPTLVDVTGAKGQRLVRAVGVTNDNAGETLVGNAAKVSSTTKPAVMAQTRGLSAEARTGAQLAADLKTARSTEAATTYAEPYAAKVDLNDREVIQALRDPEGASAIQRAITAARARMDYKAVADLQQLKNTAAGPTGDTQVWPTTGRALDRVQIAFGNKAEALDKSGAHDIASGLKMRQERINGLLDTVEGLQPARAAYRAKSQALEILDGKGRLDPFSTDPTDYGSWVKALPPEAKHANQVAIRQDILDTLGGQRAGTAGSIDELATSQYARENLTHALGQREAGAYLENLTARLAQKGNSSFVSPNAGSRTQVLENDTAKNLGHAVNAIGAVKDVATLNGVGLLARTAAYLKTRGLSDAQAEELAKASVDPARLDGVIRSLQKLKGPKEAGAFLTFRGGLVGQLRGSKPSPKQLPQQQL